jgi:hypothetical protein
MMRDMSQEPVKPLRSWTDKIYPIVDNNPEITDIKIKSGEIKELKSLNQLKKIINPS